MFITTETLASGDIVRDATLTRCQPRTVHGSLNHGGVIEIIWEEGGRSTVTASHVPQIVERAGEWIDQMR